MGTTGVSRPVVMREGMRDGRGRRFGEVAWIVGMGVDLGTDIWVGDKAVWSSAIGILKAE